MAFKKYSDTFQDKSPQGCGSHCFISLGLHTCCSLCQEFLRVYLCALLPWLTSHGDFLPQEPSLTLLLGWWSCTPWVHSISLHPRIHPIIHVPGLTSGPRGLATSPGSQRVPGGGTEEPTPLLAVEVEALVGVCWCGEPQL